jgi:hypothetical protein
VVTCWSAASAGPVLEHEASTGAARASNARLATSRSRVGDDEGETGAEGATIGVDAGGGEAQTTAPAESPGGRHGVRQRAIRTTR